MSLGRTSQVPVTTSGTGKEDGGCSLHSGRGTQVLTTQADPKEASPELVEPDFQMFTGYRHSGRREVLCSTKTQILSGKSEAGPIFGLKDRRINLLLTPSQAGLKCLPTLSLYEVDESLEKRDSIP